jgi:hypothetical protein
MPLTTVDQGLLSTNAQYTGFKNRLINGGMVIDQRNNGASVTNPGNNVYIVDRWLINTAFTGSVGRNLGGVTPPAGFSNYLGMSVGAAGQTVTNYSFRQWIEGFNSADLAFGTANAQTVTLSFWVRSSLTGTFGGALQNEAGNRSYPFGYTIAAANTWQKVTVTIPGDTTGTWVGATNGYGIQVIISYGAAAARQGPAGAWAAADYRSVTGQVDLISTNGATFYITGVQLELGSTATSFDVRSYGTEELLCFRYTQVLSGTANSRLFISGNTTGPYCYPTTTLKARMRTTPSITTSAMSNFTFESLASSGQTPTSITYNAGVNDTLTVQVLCPSSISGPGGNLQCANTSAQVIISAEL